MSDSLVDAREPNDGHGDSDTAPVHEQSWSETILRLRAGEHAPVGYEIKRLIGHVQQPTGIGTNYEDVYVVAVRRV